MLKLFVYGQMRKSNRAMRNIKKIARDYLDEKCTIEIIDIREHPESGVEEAVLAMPALIKTHPPPVGKIMGDLSDMDKVASFIGYGSKITQDSSRNQGEMP
jgi:circadian clock protein KaiB